MLARDHEIGSITAGKFADLVELSKDPYLADPMKLATEVTVQGTWVAGHRIDVDAFLKEVEGDRPHRPPTPRQAPHEVLLRNRSRQ